MQPNGMRHGQQPEYEEVQPLHPPVWARFQRADRCGYRIELAAPERLLCQENHGEEDWADDASPGQSR
jgi:hypothetical protein